MKVSINTIARAKDRSQSTTFREIQRNTSRRGYQHRKAISFAEKRQTKKPKAIQLTEETKKLITACLRKEWSPKQIAGRFSGDGRKSKLRLAAPLLAKKTTYVKDAIVSLLSPSKKIRKNNDF